METLLGFLKEKLLPNCVWFLVEMTKQTERVPKDLKDAIMQGKQTEGASEVINESTPEPLQAKLPLLLQFLSNRAREAGEALQGPQGESILGFLQEKLLWLPHVWEEVAGFLVEKLEETLHPVPSSETVRFWVQLGMAAVLLFLSLLFPGACIQVARVIVTASFHFLSSCLWGFWAMIRVCASGACKVVEASFNFLYLCVRGFWSMMRVCARGACKVVMASARFIRSCVWGGGKMMKAPGRAGLRILRASFEANPRSYFINLRAHAPWDGTGWMGTSQKFWVGLAVLGVAVVVVKVW